MKSPGLVLNASFALTGAMTTLLGPLLPALILQWSLSDAQAGRLFATQFFSSTVGAVLQGWIVSRVRASWCLAAAYGLMAVAAATLTTGSFAAGLVRVAIYGFALGISSPTANLIAGQQAPARKTAALNLLNTSWCAGAVLTPLLVGALLPSHGSSKVMLSLGGLLVMAAILTLAFPFAADTSHKPDWPAGDDARAGFRLAVFLFFYVGVESTVSGWIPAFGVRALQLSASTAGVALTLFWAALLAARGYIGLGRRVPEAPILLVGCLCSVLAGTAALAFSNGPLALMAGAILAGGGLGPVFPGMVAIYQERAGASRTLGMVLAAGGCGGASLPWLAGVLSSATHNQRATMWTGLIAAAMLLVLAGPALPHRASRK